jgi:hypothetical protein
VKIVGDEFRRDNAIDLNMAPLEEMLNHHLFLRDPAYRHG